MHTHTHTHTRTHACTHTHPHTYLIGIKLLCWKYGLFIPHVCARTSKAASPLPAATLKCQRGPCWYVRYEIPGQKSTRAAKGHIRYPAALGPFGSSIIMAAFHRFLYREWAPLWQRGRAVVRHHAECHPPPLVPLYDQRLGPAQVTAVRSQGFCSGQIDRLMSWLLSSGPEIDGLWDNLVTTDQSFFFVANEQSVCKI